MPVNKRFRGKISRVYCLDLVSKNIPKIAAWQAKIGFFKTTVENTN